MFHLSYQTLSLQKRVPLSISRGTRTESRCAWVKLEAEGIEGWGEAGEFSVGSQAQSLPQIQKALDQSKATLRNADRQAIDELEKNLLRERIPSAARAAILQAALDWQSKLQGLPAWTHLRIPDRPQVPTSVTIGILPPETAVQRLHQWLAIHPFRAFKLKLGSRDGVASDQERVLAIQSNLPPGSTLSVDANGGWSLKEALSMSDWLASHGVEHLEQPLPRGEEHHLKELHQHSPLPILVDESCFTSADILPLAEFVDGINIKLMKCGGVPEALRMIQIAKQCGLKVMLGCYGQTTLGNAAAAHLGALVDYIDLDSHLNLSNDPFRGLTLIEGRWTLSAVPGFGVTYEPAH